MDNSFEVLQFLLKKDRSIRRFNNNRRIDEDTLEKLVELTRYCASGRNLQPLRYRTVNDPDECKSVFACLKWAGYLPDWDGPEESDQPTAYLVQCIDTCLTSDCLCDDGLQLQAITLGAAALGLGACIVKSFNIDRVQEILGIPQRYKPLYVVALGESVEEVVIEDTNGKTDADIRYYRTPDMVHHVPKRPLLELLL